MPAQNRLLFIKFAGYGKAWLFLWNNLLYQLAENLEV